LKLEPDITRVPGGGWLEGMRPAIRSLSVDELSVYDVGRIKPGSRYAKLFPDQMPIDGARIPTLDQVFELVRRSGNTSVRLNVEVKSNPNKPKLAVDPETFAKAILAVTKKFGMSDRVIIQSFDWRVLQVVQELDPKVMTSYLTVQQSWRDNIQAGRDGSSAWTAGYDIDDFGGSIPRLIKAAGGDGWSPYHGDVDGDQIKQAHELGLEVVVWTANK
jgi:glycerophosphoryl diester phosphodiesterase